MPRIDSSTSRTFVGEITPLGAADFIQPAFLRDLATGPCR
jgi:hypothetical protein